MIALAVVLVKTASGIRVVGGGENADTRRDPEFEAEVSIDEAKLSALLRCLAE